MVLSSTGTGLAWISNACCDLDDTLAIGSISASSITLTGTANMISPFMTPTLIYDSLGATGAAGEILTINAGATGIEWTTAAAGAVTSVSTAAPGASTGSPLVITPTTGVVGVRSMEYNGGANIGYVPPGGTAGTFLRGDGSWASGGLTDTNSQELIFTNRLVKYGPPYTAGDYMALNPTLTSGMTATDTYNHVLTSGNPSVTPPTAMETFAGAVFRVPIDGCTTAKPNFTICSMTTAGVLGLVDTSPTVLTIEVWRLPNGPCTSGDTYLAADCSMSFSAADDPECCDAGTIVSTGHQIIEPGDAIMLTWRMDQSVTSNSLYQIWKCWIRGEWTA